jgi:hypothetical protein
VQAQHELDWVHLSGVRWDLKGLNRLAHATTDSILSVSPVSECP